MKEGEINKIQKSSISNQKKKDPLLNEVFLDKYTTIKKLGEGSFGKVYKAEYNGEFYALKFESRERTKSLLEIESKIMTYLQGPNIPYIKTYSNSGEYNILVMQYMDKSLEDLLRIRKRFSVKTTAMLSFQLIGALHFIHDKNIIHRDVKPDNCVMGPNELNENLYLIDFGLAKKYRYSRSLKHYPLTRKKRLTGTARYASIHALEGYEQSRRDDMESVGYIMAYLLRGGLPWQGLKLKSKENKYKNILEKKKEISSEELFKDFPNEFAEILEYTKNLDYFEEPKYQMLRNKLMDLCKKLEYKFDYIYDWTTEKDIEKRKMKKNITSLKTQSSLSLRSFRKRSKSRKKEKYVEKTLENLIEKHKRHKDKDKNKNKDKDKKDDAKEEKKDKEKNKEEKSRHKLKNNDKNKSHKNNEINEGHDNKDKNESNNANDDGESNDNDSQKINGKDDSNRGGIKEEDEENYKSDENDGKNNDNSNGAQIDDDEGENQDNSECCIM